MLFNDKVLIESHLEGSFKINTGWVPRWLNPVSRHSTVSFVTSSHRAVVCWAQLGKITFRYLDIINIAWAGVH